MQVCHWAGASFVPCGRRSGWPEGRSRNSSRRAAAFWAGAKVPYIHSAVLAVAPWTPLAASYAASVRTRAVSAPPGLRQRVRESGQRAGQIDDLHDETRGQLALGHEAGPGRRTTDE